jgi:hypothetical protein
MRELTPVARKIMEVFRYFRIRKDEYLSAKLLVNKRYLWRDIDEKTFNKALDGLIRLRYIERIEHPEGWRLLEAGDDWLKQRSLPF